MTRTGALVTIVALVVAACTPERSPFVCHEDNNCGFERGGEAGHCWLAPVGYDTCAYRDAACPSGWRWDDMEDLTDCIAPEHVCASLELNACN